MKLKLTCLTCKRVYPFNSDDSIPKDAVNGECNWCPQCEDSAEDYYEEKWFNVYGDEV